MKMAKVLAGKEGISIIGILTDEAVAETKKRKPTLPLFERVKLAEAIRYNDCIVTQATYLPLSNLRSIRPDIILESTSHKPEDLEVVKKCAEKIGTRVVINPYFPGQSSTQIKTQIKGENNE